MTLPVWEVPVRRVHIVGTRIHYRLGRVAKAVVWGFTSSNGTLATKMNATIVATITFVVHSSEKHSSQRAGLNVAPCRIGSVRNKGRVLCYIH